jgi:hypothetical protein
MSSRALLSHAKLITSVTQESLSFVTAVLQNLRTFSSEPSNRFGGESCVQSGLTPNKCNQVNNFFTGVQNRDYGRRGSAALTM